MRGIDLSLGLQPQAWWAVVRINALEPDHRVSPKATRDWAATCLRSKDINESVIGRLFGHTPKTQTGVYGAVDMDTMRKSLNQMN